MYARPALAQPSNATVTIDGDKYQALTVHVEFATHHDDKGLPMMGSLRTGFSTVIDMHDTDNVPFNSLSKLYDLATLTTRDKIKDIKIEYWKDDAQLDAICTYTFRGWISSFSTNSGQGSNHTLRLSLQPELDGKQFVNVKLGN